MQFVNDEEVSKDIVNDSFEFAWAKLDTIDVINWKSYLLGYIRNKCVDYIRHQEVKRKYAEFYQNLMMDKSIYYTSESDERIFHIRKVIESFPPRTKKDISRMLFA